MNIKSDIKKMHYIAAAAREHCNSLSLPDAIGVYVELIDQNALVEMESQRILRMLEKRFPEEFQPYYHFSQYYMYDAKNLKLSKEYAQKALDLIGDDFPDWQSTFRVELIRFLNTEQIIIE